MGNSYDSKDKEPKISGRVMLPFARLVIEEELLTRPIDGEHVERLSAVVSEDESTLPPILVRYIEGRGHVVTGGFHTLEAYRAAGKDAVPARVKPGTFADAMMEAASQNHQWDTVGLIRTNRAKRRAAELVTAAHPEWSDRKLAGAAGVEHHLIAIVRAVMAQVGDSPTCRIGRDGKSYPATNSVRDRVRDNSRPEYVGEIVPSWRKNGAAVLPLLPELTCPSCQATVRDPHPFPEVLAAHQFNLKHCELLLSRAVVAVQRPFIFRGRPTTEAERAELMSWALRNQIPEVYDDDGPFADVGFACLDGAPADMLP